jgi:hypothetical protein
MNPVNSNALVAIVVALAVLVALGAWLWLRRARSERLRSRFGPEYERTVRQAGSPARAEALLDAREKKVESFHVRELNPDERRRYMNDWSHVQATFVDRPTDAVIEADRLIANAMHTRGYPVTDFNTASEHLSVDHAKAVEHYRVAHAIVAQQERGAADTEGLRQAMVHFRALFEDLIGGRNDIRRPA